MVQTRDGGVGHDGHALVDVFPGVVEDGVEVRIDGETEAGDTVVGAVEDHVGSVGKGGHAGDDAGGWHTLDLPFRGRCGRVGGDAVVEGVACTGGGATADENTKVVPVGAVLWQQDGSTFEGISTATERVIDCTRHVGELFGGIEGDRIEDAGLVVVEDQDTARWKDAEEGVEVERISTL